MKVKICGLTNKEDAVWALNYGADYLGFNFWKESPRHISVKTAETVITQLPLFAWSVGVFVNADQDEIVDAVSKLKLKAVQLHGDETPAMVAGLRLSLQGIGKNVAIIKAIRMQSEDTIAAMKDFLPHVDYFLLDAYQPGQMGGTGATFNWELAVKAKELGKPIFLAGGLNPDNIADAVKKTSPFAVDVASGVEKSPKKKDMQKIQDFISRAKKQ